MSIPPLRIELDQCLVFATVTQLRNYAVWAKCSEEGKHGTFEFRECSFVGSTKELNEGGFATYFGMFDQHSFYDQTSEAVADKNQILVIFDNTKLI